MMTNSISLEEQTTQMVKQIEVLTKTINKNNAQIALLTSNVKSMEESNQLVVDPSTIFPLKKKILLMVLRVLKHKNRPCESSSFSRGINSY